MHAGWNLLARRHRSEAAFMLRMLSVIVVVGFVPAAVSESLTRSLSSTAWICALGSGIFCGCYYFCLSRAYTSSDFTVVYPVARALPIVLIACADVLRGRELPLFGWVGLGLVVFGCLLTPLHSFRDFQLSRYFHGGSLWILLTALGTVGYTLLDKIASETVRQSPATAARYGYVFMCVSYVIFSGLLRRFKPIKPSQQAIGWGFPILGACLDFGCYWLVLWAYQLTGHASYIVAFRQFSIVIGVVLAFLFYREQGRAVRLTGTLILTGGLVVIAVWGR